jgi:hypothetical protein
MSYDDADLERLLAQGNLGGPTYDRIEADVMRRVLPPTQNPRSPWIWAAILPAAAALGGLALLVETPSNSATDPGGFTAKGSDGVPAGSVELTCAADRPCRAGDTLLFVIDTSIAHGYLNASAQRIEPASPERLHLFPTAKGESPRIDSGVGTVVVPEGLRLGGAFGPGVYRIDVWFTDTGPTPDPGQGRKTSLELAVED